MKRVLKTITVGFDQDNPSYSILRGHVTATVFNKAHRAEGWSEFGWIRKSDLSHEYWVKKGRSWRRSTKKYKKAVPVTVMSW